MKKQWSLIVVVVAIVCVISSCQSPEWERLALGDVAARLGIEPTIDALSKYISSQIKIGMPYAEVREKLLEVGPYWVRQPIPTHPYRLCEEVRYDFGWAGVVLDLYLCYDDQMRLGDMDYAEFFWYEDATLVTGTMGPLDSPTATVTPGTPR